MFEIVIFNVVAGQCIFFYHNGHTEYDMLVDCHKSDEFSPINFLLKQNIL